MARTFASPDIIVTGYTTHHTTTSWGIWTYRTGDGGGSKGRMWDKNSTSETVWMDNETSGYIFQGNYTTKGYWSVARPSANAWHHILTTYDNSSTANDPVVYIDGSSVTVTETITPSGTVNTNTDAYSIGNREASSANRGWAGDLCEFASWNRILTAAEAAILGDGFSPLFIPNGLTLYCPLVRDMIDLKNGTITDTGTAAASHPRIYYPTMDPGGVRLPSGIWKPHPPKYPSP